MSEAPPAVMPASQPGTAPVNGKQGSERIAVVTIPYFDCVKNEPTLLTLAAAQDLIDRRRARPILRRDGTLKRIVKIPFARPLSTPLAGFAAPTFSSGRKIDAGEHNNKVCKTYPHYENRQ